MTEEQLGYLRNSHSFLECPPTQLWMDKHRCPKLLNLIREAIDDCVNNPDHLLDEKSMPDNIVNVLAMRKSLSRNAEDVFCHLVSKEDKRLFLYFMVIKRDEQLRISELKSCLFPIDEQLYLMPYLFEQCSNFMIPTPDHWQKLRDMGFVSKRAMDKYCNFTS
jgi:hypothetical protein